MRRAK